MCRTADQDFRGMASLWLDRCDAAQLGEAAAASSFVAGYWDCAAPIYGKRRRSEAATRARDGDVDYIGYARCLEVLEETAAAGAGCRAATREEQRAYRDLAFWECLAELWRCDGAEVEVLVLRKARPVPAPALLLRTVLPADFAELRCEQLRDFWAAALEWVLSQTEEEGRTDHVLLAQEDVREAAFKSIKKWRFFQPRKDEDGARQLAGEAFVGHRTGELEVSVEARVRDPHRGLDAVLFDGAGRAHGLSAVAHGLLDVEAVRLHVAAFLEWPVSRVALLTRRGGDVYAALRAWPPTEPELLVWATRLGSHGDFQTAVRVGPLFVEVPRRMALAEAERFAAAAAAWHGSSASEQRRAGRRAAAVEECTETRAMWDEAWELLRLGLDGAPELAAFDGAEATGLAAHALAHLWTEQLVRHSGPSPSLFALSQAATYLASAAGRAALASRLLEARGAEVSFARAAASASVRPFRLGAYAHDLRWTRLATRRCLDDFARGMDAWVTRGAEDAAQRTARRYLAEDHCAATRWWGHVSLEDEACPGCGNRDTGVFERFDRASDEASTVVMACFRCAGSFRRNGSSWVKE